MNQKFFALQTSPKITRAISTTLGIWLFLLDRCTFGWTCSPCKDLHTIAANKTTGWRLECLCTVNCLACASCKNYYRVSMILIHGFTGYACSREYDSFSSLFFKSFLQFYDTCNGYENELFFYCGGRPTFTIASNCATAFWEFYTNEIAEYGGFEVEFWGQGKIT